MRLAADHACFADKGQCPRIRLRFREPPQEGETVGRQKWITLAEVEDHAALVAGEWMLLSGHEIFEPEKGEDLELGSEFFLYVEVKGVGDYDVDDVRIETPALAPPPAWDKLGEYGGFLGIVTDSAGAYDGESYLQMYGRDGNNRDYVFQEIEDAAGCLSADVDYLVSVMVKLPSGAQCFSDDSQCPHLQLWTRHDGVEAWRWLNDIDGPEGVDGEWNVLWAQTRFSAAELGANEFFRISVRVGGSDDYWVDKAEILPMPPPKFPDDACSDLIRNGDFDYHPGAFAPWTVWGDERVEPAGGVDGGAYLSNFNRNSRGHGPGQFADTGCLQAGVVYRFSAAVQLSATHACVVDGRDCPKLVVRTKEEGVNRYAVRTMTQMEAAAAAGSEWVMLTHEFKFSASMAAAEELFLYVEGGDAGQDVGFDAIAFTRVSLGQNTLLVDGRAADGCWAVGDEVVVTSSDIHPDHAERRRITHVALGDDGKAALTIDANLEYRHEGAGEWHAEVMLLSRKILVHGTEHTTHQGGHLWVKHTAAPQTIEGVELHTMGQQGTLGRYPMHLHMCLEMPETRLASLSIHDTFQRCIVVHGTDNVRLLNVFVSVSVSVSVPCSAFVFPDKCGAGDSGGQRRVQHLRALLHPRGRVRGARQVLAQHRRAHQTRGGPSRGGRCG